MAKKSLWIMVLSFCLVISLSGCKGARQSIEKERDLDFTIVEEEDLPKELKQLIEEKRKNPFKLSYSDSNFLYIVVGYGEQPTGGFSITVDQLYLTKNAVYVNTNLIGPEKGEKVDPAVTHPYIVVKTEFLDLSVVFE